MRASYNQAEYLSERRAMMQQWADMVDSMAQGGNVTPIKRTVAQDARQSIVGRIGTATD